MKDKCKMVVITATAYRHKQVAIFIQENGIKANNTGKVNSCNKMEQSFKVNSKMGIVLEPVRWFGKTHDTAMKVINKETKDTDMVKSDSQMVTCIMAISETV